MKIAHLILAHSAPLQLERLIDRLTHKNAYFFIHIDEKISINSFNFLAAKQRVYFIKERVKVNWGAYSIVQATINGFQAIAKSGLGIDCINLLSGSDYPLKSTEEIHAYFTQHSGQNFMQYQLVNEEWHEAIPRLQKYHLTNYSFPGRYVVQNLINRLTSDRIMPDNLVAVGRSQWMSITMEAVNYILHYLETHQQVVRFFKFTWAPDEIIFQTILYNSDFRGSLVNDNLRYIDWSAGKASPKNLVGEDLEKLIVSNKLFARKFEFSTQTGIIDRLDERIQKPEMTDDNEI